MIGFLKEKKQENTKEGFFDSIWRRQLRETSYGVLKDKHFAKLMGEVLLEVHEGIPRFRSNMNKDMPR